MKKTVLITGASSGFGFQTAVKCAERGFHVIATMRNMDKAKAFFSGDIDEDITRRIEVWPLDVTDSFSLFDFENRVQQTERIDILVNNAGYALGGFVEQVPIEAYRRQFETNLFGVIRVTQAILPIMRRQKSGKIMNVSSVSGLIGFPGLSAYVASKHALEGFSESLRLEMKPFGIDVALIEPGSYQTNIWSSGMELPEEAHNPDSPYADYLKDLWKAMQQGKRSDPGDVSSLMTKLAGKDSLSRLRYPIGPGVRFTIILKRVLPWTWLEKLILSQIRSS